MPDTKDAKAALAEEWERACEHCAKELGMSVPAFKRRLALEQEIKRARQRGAPDWVIDAIKTCDTSDVRDIALRDNRAPTGPSSAGIIPSSQQISNVRGPRAPGGGTGWQPERKFGDDGRHPTPDVG